MPTQERGGLPLDGLVLLWAARRSGVLDALLESAGTPEEVAETAGVTEHAARVTVDGLEAMGFLKQVGSEYEITNRTLGFLAKRDVRSIGRLSHALDVFDLWTALPETMASGEEPPKPADWTRNRLGAQAATDETVVRACVTAAVREAPEATRTLDVAGGSGVYAREFVARGHEVMLADDPDVVDVVSPLLEPTAVDLATTELPSLSGLDGSFGLAVGVDALRRFDPGEAATLVASAADTLAPGGTLVFVDVFAREDESANADDAIAVAVDALATGEGALHAETAVREWFEAAGLADVVVRDVPGASRQAVVGHKPGDG
ncbi:Methyltransferase domain-containing protein [Halogranum gelatinilyticum]|uniref:Methyltransferase domain-containing protein n=1 Tax=Halogranum gelatinilyticum TaxID=660521 RepID=A0A1G9PUT8_9EURY|nr:methyltransferase domain-containing protein [Halogranum gelatinilyticum]SDM02251.1 Methyltransferase domain-containing protein [Halogranum gelatinilyticum]